MKGLDDDINVATVERNGLVRVYGQAGELGIRPFLYSRQYANYGQALLWVAEYEDQQRAERLVVRK